MIKVGIEKLDDGLVVDLFDMQDLILKEFVFVFRYVCC